MFLGFGLNQKETFESRRISQSDFEQNDDSESLSGVLVISTFPNLDQTFEISAHQYGVNKIYINNGISTNFQMILYCLHWVMIIFYVFIKLWI